MDKKSALELLTAKKTYCHLDCNCCGVCPWNNTKDCKNTSFTQNQLLEAINVLYEPLDYEDLYCEECGDSDWLIGHAKTREEVWNLLKNDTDIDGSGGWNYSYVQEFINNYWNE